MIKTTLTRFAADPDQAISQMPKRVAGARDLGVVLQDEPRTGLAEPDEAQLAIETWRTAARDDRQAAPAGGVSPIADGAGQPLILHEFQDEFMRFAMAMRHAGLPPGQP